MSKLDAAVEEVQRALEGFTEDCLTNHPEQRVELEAAWLLIRRRLLRLPSDGLRCGERLYLDGNLHAVCTQPGGVEHTHHDLDAQQAIAAGLARPASDTDRPHAPSEVQNQQVAEWPWQDAGVHPFSPHELGLRDSEGAQDWISNDELVGLSEARPGGIIGYIHRLHADRIAGLLNLAGMVVENEHD